MLLFLVVFIIWLLLLYIVFPSEVAIAIGMAASSVVLAVLFFAVIVKPLFRAFEAWARKERKKEIKKERKRKRKIEKLRKINQEST